MKHLKQVFFAASCARRSRRQHLYALVGCDPIVIDLGTTASTWVRRSRGYSMWTPTACATTCSGCVGCDEGFSRSIAAGNGLGRRRGGIVGIGTPLLLEGRLAPNGFVGLAQYDARQLGGMTTVSSPRRMRLAQCGSGSISTPMASPRTRDALSAELWNSALETIPKMRKYID